MTPVSWSLDTMGFFCRTVRTPPWCCRAWRSTTRTTPSLPTPARGLSEPSAGAAAPPRIGTLRRFFYEKAESEVQQVTDDVVEKLSAAGAVVEEIALEADYDDLLAAHRVVMAVERPRSTNSASRRWRTNTARRSAG